LLIIDNLIANLRWKTATNRCSVAWVFVDSYGCCVIYT